MIILPKKAAPLPANARVPENLVASRNHGRFDEGEVGGQAGGGLLECTGHK